MASRGVSPRTTSIGLWVIVQVCAGNSGAQALTDFLQSARSHNVDAQEATALIEQRTDEEKEAWYRLIPNIGVQASWTNNQYSAIANIPLNPGAPPDHLVLIPPNNLAVAATLTVPMINASAWAQGNAASAQTRAARADAGQVQLNVDRAVIQGFYNLWGAKRLVDAASASIGVSETEIAQTRERVRAGLASPVDESRSVATLAAKQEALVSAQEIAATAVETLTRVSGLPPGDLTGPPGDSLADEEPEQEWIARGMERSPSIRSALASADAAGREVAVGYRAFIPTMAGSFTEQLTNATGFTGQPLAYAAGIVITERFDASLLESARASEAAAAAARVRVDRTRQLVHEQIVRDWEHVRALIAHTRASRAKVDANRVAFEILRDRYRAGTTGSLDYQSADQDLFRSQADLIHAEALLAAARANLRLSAGLPWNAAGPRDGAAP
jgi:outer membrane protein TolC